MAEQQSQREILSASTLIAGRYRVLSELGRGGNGTVYLADQAARKTNPWAHKRERQRKFAAEQEIELKLV